MASSIFPCAGAILHDLDSCFVSYNKFKRQRIDIFSCCPNKQS